MSLNLFRTDKAIAMACTFPEKSKLGKKLDCNCWFSVALS